jgi:hypothetical protein
MTRIGGHFGRNVSVAIVLAMAIPNVSLGAAVEARPTTRAANPGVNVAVGLIDVMQGRAISTRVFRNVDAEVSQVKQVYAGYEATATSEGNARTVQILQTEKTVKLQLLEQMRKNAYQQFRKPEVRKLIAAVANVGPVSRIFTSAGGEIAGLASKLNELRTKISGGGALSLLEVQKYAAQIDRWKGAWSIITGPQGRQLGALADKASAALRKLTSATGAVDAELASTQDGLLALSQALNDVKTVKVRPRGGGFFGFVTDLLGIDRRLIDAVRDLIRPRVRDIPGYSAADIDRLLDKAMIEMMRRRLWDCGKPTGFEIGGLPDNPDLGMFPGELSPTLGPDDERLPLCGDPTTEELLATAEAALDPVADDGVSATRPTGGGVYTIDQATTTPGAAAVMRSADGGRISVRDIDVVPLIGMGGESAGTPDIQLIVDLAEGTVSGSFDARYECTPDLCMGMNSTGYARGSFGPLPFGVAPFEPPDDYPFPPHHWYELESEDWYALGAIDIEVSIGGTGYDGRAADYTTSVRGWIQVRLSAMGNVAGALPNGWRASFSASLDYPDTVNPQWFLWLGAEADIYDSRVHRPPE